MVRTGRAAGVRFDFQAAFGRNPASAPARRPVRGAAGARDASSSGVRCGFGRRRLEVEERRGLGLVVEIKGLRVVLISNIES